MLKFLRRLSLLGLIVIALLAGAAWWLVQRPLPLKDSPLDFTVAAGSSLRGAAQQIREAGVEEIVNRIEVAAPDSSTTPIFHSR